MRTLFVDPKTDSVFHRVFGSEQHKPVLWVVHDVTRTYQALTASSVAEALG